ncbi:hypothetical protein FAGKG844_240018 [Frankia sp. AgKG'84/4]
MPLDDDTRRAAIDLDRPDNAAASGDVGVGVSLIARW